MEKSNIVINTLVFLDELENGVQQSELLRSIYALGVKKVEVRREFIKDFNDELKKIKTASQELGIDIYYSVPDYLYINGKLAVDKIEGYMIEADKMNCRNVKLNIGNYHDISTDDAYALNSLCDKYSIKLTIENDQTEDNGKVDKIKTFLQQSKKLGMKLSCTFDIGNWLWQKEDPIENANILNPYVTYIHLKDVIMMDKPQAAFLDEGIIPWRKILEIFDKDIPTAIEYPCFPDTLSRLKSEIDKLTEAN